MAEGRMNQKRLDLSLDDFESLPSVDGLGYAGRRDSKVEQRARPNASGHI